MCHPSVPVKVPKATSAQGNVRSWWLFSPGVRECTLMGLCVIGALVVRMGMVSKCMSNDDNYTLKGSAIAWWLREGPQGGMPNEHEPEYEYEWALCFLGWATVGSATWLCLLLGFGRKVGSNATVHPPNEVDRKDPTVPVPVRFHEEGGVTKRLPPVSAPDAHLPKVTFAEVARHDGIDDLWVVVDDKAYDLTAFVTRHPGGVGPMVALAGKDCTDVFMNYHSLRVYQHLLPRYVVGIVVNDTDIDTDSNKVDNNSKWEHVRDFRAVRQELLRRGLFETDYRFYLLLTLWYATLFFGALWFSLGGWDDSKIHTNHHIHTNNNNNTPFYGRLVGAAIMGIFWQQLAGLGHDLGHSAVTHHFHTDHRIGSALTALMGLSLGWWKSDHNTHHVVCNSVENDPNIQHMPLLAIHKRIFEGPEPFWDTYHKKFVKMDALARFLVSHQHVLFYPVMAFGRINLYIQGLLYLLLQPDVLHYRAYELGGLVVYATWVGAVLWAQPTLTATLLWLLVSHAVAGILHVQIVLSHWSREVYKGRPYTHGNKDDEWYTMQLKTTMNVATWPIFDFVHIGLQFQVEHHLFPRLPRHNLRAARELVRVVCVKHGLDYHEPGFIEGNLEMWRALRDAAMEARQTTRGGDGGFYTSKIWEGLNLSG